MGKKSNSTDKKSGQERVQAGKETLTYLERKLKILNEMEDRDKARRLAERLYLNYKENKK